MTFDDVRRLGLALPEAEESTSYGTPALKVRGKLFTRLRAEGVLVIKVDPVEREALVSEDPDTFFITPHYADHPYMLIRLATVDGIDDALQRIEGRLHHRMGGRNDPRRDSHPQ